MLRPSAVVTHRWNTPETLRLYSSLLMMVKDLHLRTMARALVSSIGSAWLSR
jgi:hypothetical protein